MCDTMDTAQRGVEFLKRNRIGSTTFIALDKVQNCFLGTRTCSKLTKSYQNNVNSGEIFGSKSTIKLPEQ